MGEHTPVQTIKLDECGLTRLFGELEARIMETLWALQEGTVRDICCRLENCHYKTVLTVANRLVDKGALKRRRRGRAFVYRPALPREALLERVSRQTVAGLVQDFGAAAIAGLVEAVDQIAPEQLETLRQSIEQKIDQKMGDR